MGQVQTFRKPSPAKVKQCVKAAREAGIDVNCVEFRPDGTLRVLETDQKQANLEAQDSFERFISECLPT